MFGGAIISHSPIFTSGFLALTIDIISDKFLRVWSTGNPLSISLAPSSKKNISTFCFITQSIRLSPPEVVSPLSPAFTTEYFKPNESILSSIREGKDSFSSNPYPAVRLFP